MIVSNLPIRRATLEDLSAIYELESCVGKYPYPLVVIRQHFDLGSLMFVADAGHELAAYILGAFNPQTRIAHFVAVMTRPAYRGQGLARRLGEELGTALLEFSPTEFQGVVSPDNAPSLALCKAWGFSEHHREENYYGGKEVRIVLRKKQTPY
jgi:ribosomal protein S18 acetylase RimI-like enzyme